MNEDDIEILNIVNKSRKKLITAEFIEAKTPRSYLIVRNAREYTLLRKHREEEKKKIEEEATIVINDNYTSKGVPKTYVS